MRPPRTSTKPGDFRARNAWGLLLWVPHPPPSGRGQSSFSQAADKFAFPMARFEKVGSGAPAGIDAQAALLDLAADHHALDLRGSFPDPIHTHIAIEPLDRVLAHIAAATQDLQR